MLGIQRLGSVPCASYGTVLLGSRSRTHAKSWGCSISRIQFQMLLHNPRAENENEVCLRVLGKDWVGEECSGVVFSGP